MSRKILHIGLPKTATTFLQKKIFPELCNLNKLLFLGKNSNYVNQLNKKIFHLKYSIEYGFDSKKIHIVNDYLISHEGLTGEDPDCWENSSEKIKNSLGEDLDILIVLRKPSDFMLSMYLESCISKGFFIRPEKYFLNNNDHNLKKNNPKFNLDKFDYDQLRKFYIHKFNRVVFLKYEFMFDNNYLLEGLNLNNENNQKFIEKKNPKKKIKTNRALSKNGVIILSKFSNFIQRFGLRMGNFKENKTQAYFDELFNDETIQTDQSYYKKKKYFQFNLLDGYRKYIDSFLFKKRFEINFNTHFGDKIDELDEKYNSLDKIEIFQKK